MSGFASFPLGIGRNILGNAFGNLLSGGNPPVVLGQVAFLELSVPERIEFGGAQSLVVHKLPGGMRVIDAMGRDDMDINWSAILEGPFAVQQALTLDAMRVGGLPWQLTWDILTWTVIVREFKAQYVHSNWIPYTIGCVILFDNSANFTPSAMTTQTSVNNDVATAAGNVPAP